MVGNISLTVLDISLGAVPLFSLPAAMNTCTWKIEKDLGNNQVVSSYSKFSKFLHSFLTKSKPQSSYY